MRDMLSGNRYANELIGKTTTMVCGKFEIIDCNNKISSTLEVYKSPDTNALHLFLVSAQGLSLGRLREPGVFKSRASFMTITLLFEDRLLHMFN